MAELDPDLPTPEWSLDALGRGAIEVVPVPADCLDGFCHRWWRRPEALLDPAVPTGTSGIARLSATTVERAIGQLSDDLAVVGAEPMTPCSRRALSMPATGWSLLGDEPAPWAH